MDCLRLVHILRRYLFPSMFDCLKWNFIVYVNLIYRSPTSCPNVWFNMKRIDNSIELNHHFWRNSNMGIPNKTAFWSNIIIFFKIILKYLLSTNFFFNAAKIRIRLLIYLNESYVLPTYNIISENYYRNYNRINDLY